MNSTIKKVCGLKCIEEIDVAVACGYDLIGVVLHEPSSRFVPPERAIWLARYVNEASSGRVKAVAVGRCYHEVKSVESDFDFIQVPFHEEIRDRGKLMLSIGAAPERGVDCKYLIYDNSHGKGIYEEFPEDIAAISGNIILSGGLNPSNVRRVIEKYNPLGVDVSTGVEGAYGKCPSKMKLFVEEVEVCI